jgi:hypothetical protein
VGLLVIIWLPMSQQWGSKFQNNYSIGSSNHLQVLNKETLKTQIC